jgi:hypothetical protein
MLIAICILLVILGLFSLRLEQLRNALAVSKELQRTAYDRALDQVVRSMEPSGYEMEVAGARHPIYKPFVYLRAQAACRAHEYTIWNREQVHSQRTLGPVSLVAGDTLYIHVGTQLTNPNLAPSFSG